MARHLALAQSLGVSIYFCDSRSPWQRDSNDNANGLLRDYFPRALTGAPTRRRTSWPSRTSSTTGPGSSSTTARRLNFRGTVSLRELSCCDV
jgi:hypothetical protein